MYRLATKHTERMNGRQFPPPTELLFATCLLYLSFSFNLINAVAAVLFAFTASASSTDYEDQHQPLLSLSYGKHVQTKSWVVVRTCEIEDDVMGWKHEPVILISYNAYRILWHVLPDNLLVHPVLLASGSHYLATG